MLEKSFFSPQNSNTEHKISFQGQSSFLNFNFKNNDHSPIWCPRKYNMKKKSLYESHQNRVNHPKMKSQIDTRLEERKRVKNDKKTYNIFEIETLHFKLYYKSEMNNNEFIKNALEQVFPTYNI